MSAEPQMSQDALGSTSRSTGALSTTVCTAVKINEEDIDPFTYRPPLWCVHVAIRGTIATRVKDYLACTHHHRDRVQGSHFNFVSTSQFLSGSGAGELACSCHG